MSGSSQDVAQRPAEVGEGPRGLLRDGSPAATRARRAAVGAIAAVVLVAGAWLVTRSPVFAARHITVTGASHLSEASVEHLAGVGRGTNVFWLHTGAVERRLERSPWIERARVGRSLPSTITIDIVERRPVAEISDGTGFVVVADDGTVLGRSPVPGAYPLLVVDPTQRGALSSAAHVAAGMTPWLRTRVRIIAATPDTLVVHLASGIPVYYGDASSARAKDRALTAVLRWAMAGAKTVVSIDVRAPLAPTAQLPYVPPVAIPAPSPTAKNTNGKSTASPSPSPMPSPKVSPSPATKSGAGSGGGTARHHRRHRH